MQVFKVIKVVSAKKNPRVMRLEPKISVGPLRTSQPRYRLSNAAPATYPSPYVKCPTVDR